MILSKDKEKRNQQVANYVAKMEEKAKKDKEKEKKAKAVLKDSKARKQGYVTASTAAVLDPETMGDLEILEIPTISDILVKYENKTGKKGPAVYGFWLGRQYYSSLLSGKIKKPDKRVAIGLAIAFNLKGKELEAFISDFGYSFPKDKRDYIVEIFVQSNYYDTRIYKDAEKTKTVNDRLRTEQTNRNIDELNEMIYSYDEELGLLYGKVK